MTPICSEKADLGKQWNPLIMEQSDSRAATKLVGPYILGKVLGEGTFGLVRKGTHVHTQEKVAVKILDKSRLAKKKDEMDNIMQEVAIMKKMRHKNIVRLYDLLEQDNKIFLIMEFCEKNDLFDYIVNNRRLREKEACSVFQQILDAIDYIHELNICHRDLKPENILLDSDLVVKLSDFGLSKIYDTKLKTPCGTPSYAPPEMLEGHPYEGKKCDIWSLGIILFAMLCGYLPFSGKTHNELIRRIVECRLEIPSHVSYYATDMLKRLIMPDPRRRITSELIRKHKFYYMKAHRRVPGILSKKEIELDEKVLKKTEEYGYNSEKIRRHLKEDKLDTHTAVYYFCLKKLAKEGYQSITDVCSTAFVRNQSKKTRLKSVSGARREPFVTEVASTLVTESEKSVLQIFREKANFMGRSAIKVATNKLVREDKMLVGLLNKYNHHESIIHKFNKAYRNNTQRNARRPQSLPSRRMSPIKKKQFTLTSQNTFNFSGSKVECLKAVEKKLLLKKVKFLKVGPWKIKASKKGVNVLCIVDEQRLSTTLSFRVLKGDAAQLKSFLEETFKYYF